MPLWLCAARCALCKGDCERCEHRELPIQVYIDQAESKPREAVDGPCTTYDELLSVMQTYFTYDDLGRMHFMD